MAEQSRKNSAEAPLAPSVDALATKALSMVAKRNARNAARFDIEVAERLCDAAADATGNAVPNVIAAMIEAGISAEVIATVYIPHAARQMGDDWCEDNLSFARVTIGTARLQSSLRSLGSAWATHGYDEDANAEGGLIIIIAKDAFHTLGAMVLCGQLRRMGHSVRLAMGSHSEELRSIFAMTGFDAAFISASESESLDSIRECVDVIRKASAVSPPIILGGNVLDQKADVKALTGVDFVTKDPFEALEHCGIKNTKRSETPQQDRRT